MFIFNISLRKNKIFLYIAGAAIVLILTILLIVTIKSIKKSKTVYVTDDIPNIATSEITEKNYTSILKNSYENIDAYVGKKIKYSGFVHRLYDFEDNQFVLGREMVLSTNQNNQAQVVIVGFLCTCPDSSKFSNGTWIEIEGTIEKGFYHSNIPVVKVTSIKETSTPKNPYVSTPDNSYLKTETL